MYEFPGKWKQLKKNSRFYSHVFNELCIFVPGIPLFGRELLFYSTSTSLPIFLFARESAFLYHIIYQSVIIYRESCSLNIYPHFVISLFCIGRMAVFAMVQEFSYFLPVKSFSYNEKNMVFLFSFWPYFHIFAGEILLLRRNRSIYHTIKQGKYTGVNGIRR